MSDFPVVLSWCPNQSPPDKCDICAPIGAAWGAPYMPNLKPSYFKQPGLFLWNPTDYVAMIESLAGNAGGYTENAYDAQGKLFAQRSATFSYIIVSAPSDPNTQWSLRIKYIFAPDPTPGFRTGTTFSVSGSYNWIGFQFANAGNLATTYTDPVTTFL